ncbi:MAG: hypothetical protein ACT4TC_12120 [Myxococcaceae bacterium]
MRRWVCAVLWVIVGCSATVPPQPDALREGDAGASDAGTLSPTTLDASVPERELDAGITEPDPRCYSDVPSTLVTADTWPVLYDFRGQHYAYKRVDGQYLTVLFDPMTGRKTTTAAFAWLAFSPDGSQAVLTDPNAVAGPKVYAIALNTGAETLIAEGELRRTATASDGSVMAFLFDDGKVVTLDFATGAVQTLIAQSTAANAGWQAHPNGRELLLHDGVSTFLYEMPTRTLTPLGAVAAAQLLPEGGVWYAEGGRNKALRSGGAPEDLGPYAGADPLTHPRALLCLDSDGVAHVWRSGDAQPLTIGTGVSQFDLSEDGAVAAVVKLDNSVTRVDLSSGTETPLTQVTAPASARVNKDGHSTLLTLVETPTEGPPAISTVKLFTDGTEVALSPPVEAVPQFVYPSFQSSVVQVFVQDGALTLYDLATGWRKYETTRSTVGSEGNYAFWRGDALFSPVGGYVSTVFDLYAYVPASNRETFFGTAVHVDCAAGPYTVMRRDLPDTLDSAGEGELITWNPETDAIKTYSTSARPPTCIHEHVLVRESVTSPAEGFGQADVGRLLYVHPKTQRKVPVADKVTGSAVRGKRLVYSTPEALCVTAWPPL